MGMPAEQLDGADASVAPTVATAVREMTDADAPAWDRFVNALPSATFFHLSAWRDVVRRTTRHRCHFLLAERGGEVVGVLPLAHVRSRLFGNVLVSTPFSVYGGIAAVDEDAEAQLRGAARTLGRELGVDHVELRQRDPHGGDGLGKDLYVTFRKTISADHDENMKAIPRKQRAMVRKAIKGELRSTFDADTTRFFALYSESVRNLGTPVMPAQWFRTVHEVFGDACQVLTVETADGTPLSSVLSYRFRDEVLPYYGGGGVAARQHKANDFMYWEVMRHAADAGVRLFDYGRSKVGVGSYSFKKNWGFTPEPLHYEYHLVRASELPDVNPLNPKYRLFVNGWRKLPLPVSRHVGPFLARQLA